jgi:hypothetical protein
VANTPTTLVVIVPGLNGSIGFYPNPLTLNPQGEVRWHCNPLVRTEDSKTFIVRFADESLFGVASVEANIGETTPALTVSANAKPDTYSYQISVGGQNYDPEIIIEEVMLEPRAMRAHTAR